MDMTAEFNAEEDCSTAAPAADCVSPEAIGAEAGPTEPSSPSISEPETPHDAKAIAGESKRVQASGASPRLELLPSFVPRREGPTIEAAARETQRNFAVPGLAAGLALLFLLGAGAVYERMHGTALLAEKVQENEHLVSTVSNLTERLDAIEATRAREETSDAKKLLGEIKQNATATRDVSAAIAQLTTRVDHIERDQGARLDKLAERIDHDSSSRFADLAARLDKLEKKAAAPTVATVAPTPPPRQTPPLAKAEPAKADPGVSNETTGSVDKPKPPLRGYTVVDVRDGFAMVEGRDGAMTVAPGDSIPGLGRVLRIERHGREWIVVTSLGVIGGEAGPY